METQKKINHNSKGKMTVVLAVIFLMLFVQAAWATLSFLKPYDSDIQSTNIKEGNASEIPEQLPENSKSHAPEPTTLALFGSGVLGMVVSAIRKAYNHAKRIFDIFVSIVAFIILSPLFLFAAVLIKLSSRGPVLFTQERVGKDGKHFKIYKFRTMRVDAEKETGPVWAKANDTRLIPSGRFLRKTHIDEIPQFFNVLIGDMSIIGPRPERPVFVTKFKEIIPDYEQRLSVKPGITGLAQVWHKYDETIEDVRKKIRYDLLYIKKLCLWTDLKIFLRTFRVVLTGEGAR